MAIETMFVSTPIKVIIGTCSDLNQFRAILLGVFNMKIPPIADTNDPTRQIYGCPSLRKVLSHTPVAISNPEMKKLNLIPFLLMIQLQGKANNVCALGKKRVLRETYTMERWYVFSTKEFKAEKVLIGRDAVIAVKK